MKVLLSILFRKQVGTVLASLLQEPYIFDTSPLHLSDTKRRICRMLMTVSSTSLEPTKPEMLIGDS